LKVTLAAQTGDNLAVKRPGRYDG